VPYFDPGLSNEDNFAANAANRDYYDYVNIDGGAYSISWRFMLVYFVMRVGEWRVVANVMKA